MRQLSPPAASSVRDVHLNFHHPLCYSSQHSFESECMMFVLFHAELIVLSLQLTASSLINSILTKLSRKHDHCDRTYRDLPLIPPSLCWQRRILCRHRFRAIIACQTDWSVSHNCCNCHGLVQESEIDVLQGAGKL